jgi:putative hydrolase of the HAD superfamily
MNSSPVRGILFDWRGTLFHDEEDVDWIRASAASIGRDLSVAQAMELLALDGTTGQHPDVIAARHRADCSVDLNRAATLFELRLAGYDDDLALAIWQRDGSPGVSLPYTDVPEVLAELKTCGMRIGVVSDIHYDLRPVRDCVGRAGPCACRSAHGG